MCIRHSQCLGCWLGTIAGGLGICRYCRLQAFETAGADVLFASGLPDLAAVRTVCSALTKPVNFMVGIKGRSFSVAELEAAGVRRISLATSLYRAAMTGLLDAAREICDQGTFGFLDRIMNTSQLNGYLRDRPPELER